MKHLKVLSIILAFFAATFPATASPQDDSLLRPAESYLKKVAVQGILRNYTDWSSCEISGKLRMPGLPVTPTIKIFMVRDELIRMSLRAPFIGEAGRIEIDRDSVLLVNKMKRTYCKESISDLLKSYPAGITDLQSFFLGRIILPAHGVLSEKNAADVDFYPTEQGGWMIVPDDKIAVPGFGYAFLTNADGTIAGWLVEPDIEGAEVYAEYSYQGGGTDIDVTLHKGLRDVNVSLELGKPSFGAQGFDTFNINSRYRRLGIKDFIKLIK